MADFSNGQTCPSANPTIETMRRVGLAGALAVAAWLAFLTCFQPSIQVSDIDATEAEDASPAGKPDRNVSSSVHKSGDAPPGGELSGKTLPDSLQTGNSITDDIQKDEVSLESIESGNPTSSAFNESSHEASLPKPLIDPKERGGSAGSTRPVIAVQGQAWEKFFASVKKTFASNMPVAGWEHRIGSGELASAREHAERSSTDSRDFFKVWFFPSEEPLRELDSRIETGKSYYLKLQAPQPAYLQIYYSAGPRLHGFGGILHAPEAFSYPYRKYAMWVALGGLLFYIVLPWSREGMNTIAMTAWRVVLGDFASLGLLFAPFFLAPLAIVGGSVEAVTDAWWFTAMFWLLAFLGLVSEYLILPWAVYQILVRKDSFRISRLDGSDELSLKDIEYIKLACLGAPQWLQVANAVAFVATPTAQAPCAFGRYCLLKGSQLMGLYVHTRDNRSAYIWYTDQSGNICLTNWDKFIDLLEKANIEFREEVVSLRKLVPPFKDK